MSNGRVLAQSSLNFNIDIVNKVKLVQMVIIGNVLTL